MPGAFFPPVVDPDVVDHETLVTRARSILLTAHYQLFDSHPDANQAIVIAFYFERRHQAIQLLRQAAEADNNFANALVARIDANSLGEQQFMAAFEALNKADVLGDWLCRSLRVRAIIEPVPVMPVAVEMEQFGDDLSLMSPGNPAAGG